MKSKLAIGKLASIATGVAITAASHGQTIGIHLDGNVYVDVNTIPTEQFWVTESPDLVNWTKHSFVEQSTSIDCGAPASDRQFYRLKPLYGQVNWTSGPNMPVARDQFTGGVINDKLYIFGGNGIPNGVNLSSLDIYDLATNQWLPPGTSYDFGIEELSAAVVGGKLYVFGGWAGTEISIGLCYDPVIDSWTTLPAQPTPVLDTTVVAWGEKVLLLGGCLGDEKPYERSVQAYSPQTGLWEIVTELPDNTRWFGAGIRGDILYLVGGVDRESLSFTNVVRRYDLEQREWLPAITGTLPIPIGATYSSACPIINGKLIIGGGVTTTHGGFTVNDVNSEIALSEHIIVYDLSEDTFTTNEPLPERFDDHLFLRAGERLLSLGGRTAFASDVPTSRMFIGTFED